MNSADFQWDLMVATLRGVDFNNYGLQQIAQVSCGEVISSTTYELMTKRLYTKDWRERFIDNTQHNE